MSNSRRKLLQGMALSSAAVIAGKVVAASEPSVSKHSNNGLKGNVKHSVSRWTYGDLDIEQLCVLVKSLGFSAIDLVGPEDWPSLKKHNIDSSMCNGAELNLVDGWIHPEFHDELTRRYLAHIELVSQAGYKNLVCFSGNARGMDPEQGLKNAVEGLRRILPAAQKQGVMIQMELFNSKIDHPDYMADNSAWGIELCKQLDSPNFKLLYDIYHMQINEGDIIRTIGDNHQYFGHYHTAGVPGRNEIDDTQELFYPAIVKAILKTGYQGYLAQEFIPTPNTPEGRAESLRQAIHICDV
ncbi:hydroxypyruvate isomerase family protein [Paraglaciecola arctica]|uniref:hydroxypyruvate isomerase family protein n=1 Tax=Paraglaciecola arctica TaxID=1128911 RepID=UPI001C075097|nr:TIM barrel protein [Paraglaciecola arctica]MBU3005869.1 TIM barrel protein [Paraglaciecola arctica]